MILATATTRPSSSKSRSRRTPKIWKGGLQRECNPVEPGGKTTSKTQMRSDQQHLCLEKIKLHFAISHSAHSCLQPTVWSAVYCLLGVWWDQEVELGIIRVVAALQPNSQDDLTFYYTLLSTLNHCQECLEPWTIPLSLYWCSGLNPPILGIPGGNLELQTRTDWITNESE